MTGPNHGNFDVPHTSVAQLSLLIQNPPSAVYLPVLATSPERGEPPLLSPALLNLLDDVEIQDQANKDDIHHQPGKNKAVSKMLFAKPFHLVCLTWPYIYKVCEYAPAVRPLQPRTGLHPKAASRVTC